MCVVAFVLKVPLWKWKSSFNLWRTGSRQHLVVKLLPSGNLHSITCWLACGGLTPLTPILSYFGYCKHVSQFNSCLDCKLLTFLFSQVFTWQEFWVGKAYFFPWILLTALNTSNPSRVGFFFFLYEAIPQFSADSNSSADSDNLPGDSRASHKRRT